MSNLTNESDNSTHKGHRQRLREIINKSDITLLPEHQILEIILTYVLPQKDVNPLAHKLINEFGSIANVFDASSEMLKQISGVGEVASSFLNLCSKIPEIYCNSRTFNQTNLTNVKEIIEFVKKAIGISSYEKFYYICLDAKGNLLCFKTIGSGSISQLYINNREFIQEILKFPTQTVVICHTHPRGEAMPSKEDLEFTNNVRNILASLSIRLCDHIILTHGEYFSFFEHNLLNTEENLTSEQIKKLTGNKSFGSLKSSILFNDQFEYNAKTKKD